MSRWTDSSITLAPYQRADTDAWEWAVSAPLVWEVGHLGSDFQITVPMGFSTDLGSVPAWLRWLFSGHDPQCVKAYVLHDFILLPQNRARGWSSQFAAAQLIDAMRVDGVPRWSRRLQYHGINLGIAQGEW